MLERLPVYLATLPAFAAYFALAIALLLAFLWLYSHVTPHRELDLIRAGNSAAAVALVGSTLGFVLPLASVIAHAVSILDMVVWGLVALIVQIATFLVLRWVKPELSARIEEDKMAAGVFLGGLSLAIGVLNAACMTS